MTTPRQWLNALLVALQFLTIVPVRIRDADYDTALKQSPVFYPLVGLAVGILLWLIGVLCQTAPPAVAAVIILSVWVVVSGGLHLDGLADTTDAWVGGHGDCEKTLTIMKDPASGPVAISAVVLVLLMKFAALEALMSAGDWLLIMTIPMLARLAVMLLIACVPYVRAAGLGSVLAAQTPRQALGLSLILSLLLLLLVAPVTMLGLLLVAAATTVLISTVSYRRLGGMTGDIYGAVIEIVEAVLVITLVLFK